MELRTEITGQCVITNQGSFFSFKGMVASFCLRDEDMPYYRGLGTVALSGHLMRASSGNLLTFDPAVLFEIENTMLRARPELNLDTSEEIALLRKSLADTLVEIAQRDLGIDLLE